jgi:hypothetical protein
MDTTRTHPRGAVARSDEGWSASVLQPRNGPVERAAVRVADGHPVLVFLAAMLTGLALIATASIALGFLVTRVLLLRRRQRPPKSMSSVGSPPTERRSGRISH